MVADTYRIVMGAYGWIYPAWTKSFYPDDLPEEWQLGFYGNEFPVVLLPAHYWDSDDETIQGWIEDSGDNLKIICEFASIVQFQSNLKRLSLLGDRCGGIVCRVGVAELGTEQIDLLKDCHWPVCLDLNDDELDKIDQTLRTKITAQGIGFVWHGGATPCQFENATLALARVDSKDMGMRDLRQVVETLLQQTRPEQMTVLIFSGNPPDIETIRNAQLMLELF